VTSVAGGSMMERMTWRRGLALTLLITAAFELVLGTGFAIVGLRVSGPAGGGLSATGGDWQVSTPGGAARSAEELAADMLGQRRPDGPRSTSTSSSGTVVPGEVRQRLLTAGIPARGTVLSATATGELDPMGRPV
jgi:hypothetical protein